MLTASRRLKLGFLVAALAGAIAAISAGPAVATMVKSDAVAFKGTVGANGEFKSSACKLKSDGDVNSAGTLETFPCAVRGQATGIGAPTIEVTSTLASADGEVVFGPLSATLVKSEPPKYTYGGTGPCVEREETEPGSGKFVEYKCTVKLKLKFNTATGTVIGNYAVFEESTLP